MTKTEKWRNRSNFKHYSQEQLIALESKAGEKIHDLIESLDLDLKLSNRYYVGACPVHGGDKKNSFNIFHDGDEVIGNWRCFTNNCHKHFKPSLLGFVRGYISKNKYGWEYQSDVDKECPFHEAIDFLLKFTNTGDISNIELDYDYLELSRFSRNINHFYTPEEDKTKLLNIPREVFLDKLSSKSPYFTNRGFSPATIDEYDVRFCDNPTKEMYNRCVIPIYDESGDTVIGCTGRIIFDMCPLCKMYHNPIKTCPAYFDYRCAKWIHNKGFPAENYLYNYWKSREFIKNDGVIVITESPGNVWRLNEAGIKHSVATFGAHMTEKQRNLVDMSGAMTIIVLMDPDSAGMSAAQDIKTTLENTYTIYIPDKKIDIGESDTKTIRDLLNPILDKVTTLGV